MGHDYETPSIFKDAENPAMYSCLDGLRYNANNIINDAYKRGLEEGKRLAGERSPNGSNNAAYAVVYDDHQDGFGTDLFLLGVYSTYEKAEMASENLKTKGRYFKIIEIEIDRLSDAHLGGYCE